MGRLQRVRVDDQELHPDSDGHQAGVDAEACSAVLRPAELPAVRSQATAGDTAGQDGNTTIPRRVLDTHFSHLKCVTSI